MLRILENFGNKKLGFVVMRLGTRMLVTKKMFFSSLSKQWQSVSDSFENIAVKIRFIPYKYMKAG